MRPMFAMLLVSGLLGCGRPADNPTDVPTEDEAGKEDRVKVRCKGVPTCEILVPECPAGQYHALTKDGSCYDTKKGCVTADRCSDIKPKASTKKVRCSGVPTCEILVPECPDGQYHALTKDGSCYDTKVGCVTADRCSAVPKPSTKKVRCHGTPTCEIVVPECPAGTVHALTKDGFCYDTTVGCVKPDRCLGDDDSQPSSTKYRCDGVPLCEIVVPRCPSGQKHVLTADGFCYDTAVGCVDEDECR